MKRTFCVGDIHGSYRGLKQVLERCGFDKLHDALITIGDVADGWPDVAECINELLTIQNLIPILGNHDAWLSDYLVRGSEPVIWLIQGGQSSRESYFRHPELVKVHLEKYFSRCMHFHIDDNNNAYVHGGYLSKTGLGNDADDIYMWDRTLWEKSKAASHPSGTLKMTNMYNKLFIGHTNLGDTFPQKNCNVWNLDTGGGWEGKITIMDVETEAFWQSDNCVALYPEITGRRKK